MTRRAMLPIVAFLAAAAVAGVRAEGDIRNKTWPELDPFTGSRLSVLLRPRYNRITEDDKPLEAEGGTYRAVLGWHSRPVLGLRATLEAIATGSIGTKRFNEVGAMNSTSPYPLLPDPRFAGVNQAFVEGGFLDDGLRVKAGRQVVRLDNQRWISDNDFRQIPQLFDGVSAGWTVWSGARLDAGRFWRVRNTSGDVRDVGLTFARLAWNPVANQSLAAYVLAHDDPPIQSATGFADSAYRVAGLRFEGSLSLSRAWDATYVAEAAQQRPHGGDARVRARYWRVGGGASSDRLTLRADYEVKGSNGGSYGLQAPLTDFYAWNGWTLHFFNTPREGLRDAWVTARAALLPAATLYAEFHRFRADSGGGDLGRELDVGLTYELTPEAVLRLQHGRYDAAAAGGDVRKTWLTLTWTY